MAASFEIVTPTIIPNTTMEKGMLNGVHKVYRITPNEGYVLHDKVADEETLEGGIIRRYGVGSASCGANYDFTPLFVTDEHGNTFTAYGAQREFYARLQSEVDGDNIYGVGDNNHEIM